MIDYFKTIRQILKNKNALIRVDRQKLEAAEHANRILSAYIAVLADSEGCVKISRSSVRSALGKYKTEISSDGEFYIVTVKDVEEKQFRGEEGRGGE